MTCGPFTPPTDVARHVRAYLVDSAGWFRPGDEATHVRLTSQWDSVLVELPTTRHQLRAGLGVVLAGAALHHHDGYLVHPWGRPMEGEDEPDLDQRLDRAWSDLVASWADELADWLVELDPSLVVEAPALHGQQRAPLRIEWAEDLDEAVRRASDLAAMERRQRGPMRRWVRRGLRRWLGKGRS